MDRQNVNDQNVNDVNKDDDDDDDDAAAGHLELGCPDSAKGHRFPILSDDLRTFIPALEQIV